MRKDTYWKPPDTGLRAAACTAMNSDARKQLPETKHRLPENVPSTGRGNGYEVYFYDKNMPQKA